MLNSDVDWPNHRQFESNTEWEPLLFFSEGLCNSTRFDLMLGYFSSSAIRTLSDGFALFLYNGGEMRLIINNVLSVQDKEAVINGEAANTTTDFDLTDIKAMKTVLSENDKHFFECLAWLISKKKIDIRIIKPKGRSGIAHTKTGVFYDDVHKVAFNGSCNFTRTALLENIETISAICDWDGDVSMHKIAHIEQKFENVFSQKTDTVDYIDAHDIITEISEEFGGKDIQDLIEDEKSLYSLLDDSVRPGIKKALEVASSKIKKRIKCSHPDFSFRPAFPFPQGPRPYQVEAYLRWKDQQAKGLFAMATGTGKTITSLNCLLEIYKKFNYYKALILVPTITLLEQWEEECRKFNFNNIIKVSSKDNWTGDISNIFLSERLEKLKNISYVVIATYASYAKPKVFNELNQLSRRILLIADECHNMGSPSLLKNLNYIMPERRIGLSATPERQYDNETNKAVYDFFGVSDSFTFEYSMEEAIQNGVLCKYYYYPHLVELNESEMRDYRELSEKIVKFYDAKTETFKNDPILTKLLLARKRIIHKAKNKISAFKKIIEDRYKEKRSLKYTLVYVPEGEGASDYCSDQDFATDVEYGNDGDWRLIDDYTEAIRSLDRSISVRKYVSESSDRIQMLEDFASGDIDVLTSMKCLDEGVDVPRAELAIFCASTGNPRQFIQRRGRILRNHPDKMYATIHDLVVAPKVSYEDNTFFMERNLLKKELLRVNNFATLSINATDSIDELYDIMNYYNLNIYNND